MEPDFRALVNSDLNDAEQRKFVRAREFPGLPAYRYIQDIQTAQPILQGLLHLF
jgi:hypothetical protein